MNTIMGKNNSQDLYSRDYVFNENGGKGVTMSSFLKNLSISNSPPANVSNSSASSLNTPVNNTTSNIIGNSILQLNESSNPANVMKPYTHKQTSPELKSYKSRKEYFDLDDDWDSNIDQSLRSTNASPKSIENPVSRTLTNKKLSKLNRSVSNSSASSLNDFENISAGDINGMGSNSEFDIIDIKTLTEIQKLNTINSKLNKFNQILKQPNIPLTQLKKLSWNGISAELRPTVWKLLLGYLPTNTSRRASTLARKRKEYLDGITQNFHGDKDLSIWNQIQKDVPRTNPHIKLYSYATTQKSLEKILYLWSVRHPASGYVQGINDLCTPFFQVFLSEHINEANLIDNNHDIVNVENYDPTNLSEDVMNKVESDTFWCLTKLLDTITDNYIHEQPGIIRQITELKNLISKIDPELSRHFQEEGIEFIQFSFRWINCLLMRELNINLIIRVWDTYLSETPLGFNGFHVYVCAAFLVKFSDELKKLEFQEIMLFLQNPPTQNWTFKDIELILSEGFIWQSLYKNASAHLR